MLYRLLIVLLATTAIAACSKAGTGSGGKPSSYRSSGAPQVIVETVRSEPAVTRAEAVGTSRAKLSTDVYAPSSGEVVAVGFEPGQAVRRGDVLVEIDARRERLAVELAELREQDAQRLYDRYRQSATKGAVDANTLDAARTAYEIARVELQQARVALADRTIRAPFDGYVGATDIDIGDRVTTATLVTTIDDRSELLVRFDIPEAFIGELAVGEYVELAGLNRNTLTATGEVIDIGSRIDPATRTFQARARVANDDDVLRPGMSFRVGLEVRGQDYVVVPETAVQWGTDGAYIFRVVDGRALREAVQVVQRRDGTVLIDSDLNPGAIVVVEGTQRVRDGVDVAFEPLGSRLASDKSAGSASSDTKALLSD